MAPAPTPWWDASPDKEAYPSPPSFVDSTAAKDVGALKNAPPLSTALPMAGTAAAEKAAAPEGDDARLPLKEWIAGALGSLGGGHDRPAASAPYLKCALKIAHSLAAQLCEKVDPSEPLRYGGGGGATTGPWSDRATVRLGDVAVRWDEFRLDEDEGLLGRIEEEDLDFTAEALALDPLPSAERPASGPGELQAMLNDLLPDQSVYLEGNEGHGEAGDAARNGGEVGSSPSPRSPVMENGSNPVSFGNPNEGEGTLRSHSPEIEKLIAGEDPFKDSSPFDGIFDDGDMKVGAEHDDDAFLASLSFDPFDLEENGPGAIKAPGPPIGYLNVSGAELALSSDCAQDERRLICSLGGLFLELFSGGKRCVEEDDATEAFPDFGTAMTIIDALGDDDELFGNRENGRKKRRDAGKETSVYAEQLHSLGVPDALCNLVGSMIESSKGVFSAEEAYGSLTDVKEDLALMLARPNVYLKNSTETDATAARFQLDGNGSQLFGRDAELDKLKEVYRRAASKEGEESCAIIEGPPGIGKSKLSRGLIKYALHGDTNGSGSECIVLAGKFDKLQQSQPFSAVLSAFDKYCQGLSGEKNAAAAEKVASRLEQVVGRDVCVLSKLMPNLSKVMGEKADLDAEESGDLQKRLRYLLCQFVEIICSSQDCPLILHLDDLQWADKASLAFINQVLLLSGSSQEAHRIFFLGCCRELKDDHPLWKMLRSVHDFGVTTTKIELDCLDKASVNSLISEKLRLLPRLTRPLADLVWHKTKGSPLFIWQLLMELCKDSLLSLSLSRHRWIWNAEEIYEREMPSDVIEFITNSLKRLSKEVVASLRTLACFGTSSDCSLIAQLEKEVGLSLSGPLDKAVDEGYLNKRKEKYSFVHDRLQEAVYSMFKPEEVCVKHIRYGMALCAIAEREHDDNLVLLSAGQLNLGGPGPHVEKEDRQKAAELNLQAGRIALNMSDFFSGYWFFDHGISFLQKRHWEERYELSLGLYNGLAECALAKGGEQEILEIATEQVLHYARCLEDKLNMLFIKMRVLLHKSQLAASVEHGCNVLAELGENIPDDITPEVVIRYMESTKAMLENVSDEDLMNYKVTHDPTKEIAIRFLLKLAELTNLTAPSDQPVFVLKMVQLSLMHGMSPLAPMAFALYASLLASMGDIGEGYRFAKVSKALLNKPGAHCHQIIGAVFAYTNQIFGLVEPIQSVTELHARDTKAAMAAGGTGHALTSNCYVPALSFWSGTKLSQTQQDFEDCERLMKQHNNRTLLAMVLPPLRSTLTLHGMSSHNGRDEDSTKLEGALLRKSLGHSKVFYLHKMLIAFMFRKFDDAKSYAEKYGDFNMNVWVKTYSECNQLLYSGLVSYWIGREEDKTNWVAKGNESKLELQKLVGCSKWNFENKWLLLCAEEQFCQRNFEPAEVLYDKAIASAKEHRFVHEEALANECAALFYLETGRRQRSIAYFSQAIEKYREWEAFAKAKSLEATLEQIVASA